MSELSFLSSAEIKPHLDVIREQTETVLTDEPIHNEYYKIQTKKQKN